MESDEECKQVFSLLFPDNLALIFQTVSTCVCFLLFIDKVGFRQRFQLTNYRLTIKSKSELSW